MRVEMIEVNRLVPYERNPRHNDAAVDAVAQSIQQFGWRVPIVCDEQMVIICGHTRYKAALKLGLRKVPVHIATDLTPEQIKAYRIADNKSAELSDWNYDLLPIELAGLQEMNYDLGLLGFDQDELAKPPKLMSRPIKAPSTPYQMPPARPPISPPTAVLQNSPLGSVRLVGLLPT